MKKLTKTLSLMALAAVPFMGLAQTGVETNFAYQNYCLKSGNEYIVNPASDEVSGMYKLQVAVDTATLVDSVQWQNANPINVFVTPSGECPAVEGRNVWCTDFVVHVSDTVTCTVYLNGGNTVSEHIIIHASNIDNCGMDTVYVRGSYCGIDGGTIYILAGAPVNGVPLEISYHYVSTVRELDTIELVNSGSLDIIGQTHVKEVLLGSLYKYSFTLEAEWDFVAGTSDSVTAVLVFADGTSHTADIEVDFVTDCGSPASLEDTEEAQLSVFPNPTDGTFAIEAENITNVEIFDLAGQKVLTDRSGNRTINAGSLPTGVYFLKVETQNGTKYGKLIKK